VIISHQHRFVFVRTHKTASTSVEAFLGTVAGDDAVVTPIRWPEVPGHVARNYERLRNPVRSVALQLKRRSFDSTKHPAFYNHMSAAAIRKRMGRRMWDRYFTFCFERNPWEKVISGFFWERGRRGVELDFEDYVLHASLPSDFDRYSFDGRSVGVDFVGRYEHLDEELQKVLDRLGIRTPVALGREKGNFRPREATVDTMFTDAMSARVERVFAREIAAFGFEPPKVASPEIKDRTDGV
jgi:hypothetical protein